jgi:hypothetical protein
MRLLAGRDRWLRATIVFHGAVKCDLPFDTDFSCSTSALD